MNHSEKLELSYKLHELTLTSERTATELKEKNGKAEKINRDIIEKKNILNKVNEQIRKIKERRERAIVI